MEGFILPLEHRIHSWLMMNSSKTMNATYYPFFLPASPVQQENLPEKEMTKVIFDIDFQGLSLGFLSLFILQKSFRELHTKSNPGSLFTGKCKFRFNEEILANILKTAIGVPLLFIFLPLLLPIVSIFWIISTLVKIIYNFQFKNSGSKAEGMDGVWGLESKESRPVITTCLLLNGYPDINKICHHISTKVLNILDEQGNYKFKKFRQTFSRKHGYYMWRDVESFDISNHVRVIDLQSFYEKDSANISSFEQILDSKENEEISRKKRVDALLHRFLSEESDAAFPGGRSPWEVLLLVRGDGRYNTVIRLHHAIGDGVSLMRLCVETLVDKPLNIPAVGAHNNNIFVRVAMMIWSAMVLPLGLLQVVINFDNNSLHGCSLSGKKVIVSSRGLPLPILKEIKIAAGATVNDVLMSCLSAALSKHFSLRSEEVGNITSIIPVSFHDLKSPLTLSNQFGIATVKLPTSHKYTSTARLRTTKAFIDGMKRDPTLLAVFALVKAISGVLPARIAEILLSGKGVTVVASNVPGPQQEITIWGDIVEDLHFWVPNRAPVGVGFSFSSYKGIVNVGLNIDTALVHSREEAQQLLDNIEVEMYALHRLLITSKRK